MQNTINILRANLCRAVDGRGVRLYDDREVRAIVDLVLEDVCGVSRTDRILYPEQQLDAALSGQVETIAAALSLGVPVQQAIGRAWFCDRYYKVSPDVLIPRPETAELVEWIALSAGEDRTKNRAVGGLKLLDIGTGTGCIALSLARLINNSHVVAVDLSTAALAIAAQNAEIQHIENVDFVQCDILSAVEKADDNDGLSSGYQQKFDIIVSNPPYICRREAAAMSDIVLQHEPDLALFVPDDDPLLFYRTIARFGLTHLQEGGWLYFEINAAYGEQTCRLLRDLGYSDVTLRQDVTGRDRMVRARLSNLNFS